MPPTLRITGPLASVRALAHAAGAMWGEACFEWQDMGLHRGGPARRYKGIGSDAGKNRYQVIHPGTRSKATKATRRTEQGKGTLADAIAAAGLDRLDEDGVQALAAMLANDYTVAELRALGKEMGWKAGAGTLSQLALDITVQAKEKSAQPDLTSGIQSGTVLPETSTQVDTGGSTMDLQHLLAGDLTDETGRKITADALEVVGRGEEAKLLRRKVPVVLTDAGAVVTKEAAEGAAARKREPRPGPSIGGTGKDRRQVGATFRSKKWGGMYVITSTASLGYVSDDQIEDMDAWADYPDGPGRYYSWDAVPVEETAGERKERETEEAEKAATRSRLEAVKAAEAGVWASVAALPQAHDLPAGVKHADLTWTVVSDDRTKQPMGHYGTVRSIATLPTGETIGHVSSTQYDDWRSWYHLPAAAADAAHWAQAEKSGQGTDWAREFLAKYGPGVEGGKAAEAILRAPPEVQARIEAAAGRKVEFRADEARASALLAQLATTPFDSPEYDTLEAERAAIREKHAGSTFGVIHQAGFRSKRGVARMQELDNALSEERLPSRHSFEATDEERDALHDAGDLYEETGDRQHIDAALAVARAIHERTRPEREAREKEAAEEAARKKATRSAAAKARKDDPLVTVTGNTYPVKDRIKAISGARWDATRRVWRVPLSQVSRLPKGTSHEE